jgi:hypothetical protein
LTVISAGRAFGLEMHCQAYFGVEELLYSNVAHGDETGTYDGSIYIKEAMHSALLKAQADCNPTVDVRHFLFVGGDYCYEVLSVGEPTIHAFNSDAEAVAWASQSRS